MKLRCSENNGGFLFYILLPFNADTDVAVYVSEIMKKKSGVRHGSGLNYGLGDDYYKIRINMRMAHKESYLGEKYIVKGIEKT